MVKKIIASFFCCVLLAGFAYAQPKSQKPEDVYHWRIKQEKLDNVYIPKDIAECFVELNNKISKDSKEKFLSVNEYVAMTKLHYSLGRWIWYNWGLYEGSRLSVYMNKVGIKQPEDMADFIVVAYHRYLRKEPINPEELVTFFTERSRKEKEAKAKN